MPLQATSGAASYDAFGGGVAAVPQYIEDVFSTWLYTGNGSTQTITNGIDLAGEGGLVWIRERNLIENHILVSSVGNYLLSNSTAAALSDSIRLTAFTSSGFSVGTNFQTNANGNGHVSWTFRKQPKFFDVVTWTGNGANRTIAHNLGSVPGCIIVKRTDNNGDWQVYHRSLGNTQYLILNGTAMAAPSSTRWNDTTPTDTVFSLGTDATVNASGGTYVAYLFAHDAGGFGLTGTDNVISCGSFTTDGSGNATVNLGYEPQWVMIKRTSSTGNWTIADTMRGLPVSTNSQRILFPNLASAEAVNSENSIFPTATGFVGDSFYLGAGNTYIYIAIRRGPMKTPTSGTSVFAPVARTGTGTVTSITGIGFAPDLSLSTVRASNLGYSTAAIDRLRGTSVVLTTSSTAAEITGVTNAITAFQNTSETLGADGTYGFINFGRTYANWIFGRAPGFFDVVCYQGSGIAGRAINHNLGVAPELMIVKSRSSSSSLWVVGATSIGVNNNLFLNATDNAFNYGATYFFNTNPTSSVFYVGNDANVNASVPTYVAYLFASCPGVSKVFNYTGNGSSQTINCGFTGGARFVMIKRTDNTGDWYVWDSARGIVSGNDPRLSLNTTAAEVTTDDSVDTDSTGFVVNQVAATNVNVNAATYIGLAIA